IGAYRGATEELIWSPEADPGGFGEVYLVYGKTDGVDTVDLGSLDEIGSGGFTIAGLANDDWLGNSLSGAGYINGDGYDDII
ncbi:hypothetical protein NPN14_25290, partial [Vibrio parahaemolyticus]|uniref:hypothetical protein n=1 Tax=Vibrio parahaemolyticus TaxID=670 RepID=UPI0021136AAE